MNISPFDFQLQFTFANDAMAELDRKLALLYSCLLYTSDAADE